MAHINRIMIPAALLALVGSSANAQFVVDHPPAAPEAPMVATVTSNVSSHDNTSNVTVMVTEDDGKVYELKIKNDKIIRVKIDGKEWPKKLVKRSSSGVIALNDNGDTVYSFQIPVQGVRVDALPMRVGVSNNMGLGLGNDMRIGMQFEPAVIGTPPVMLGINMSEPGAALRAQIGIGDIEAILVDTVIEGLPAEEAGVEVYDVIVSINGSEGASSEILRDALLESEPGDTLTLKIKRAGETIKIKAKLVEYDAESLGMAWAPRSDAGDARDAEEEVLRDYTGWVRQLREGDTQVWLQENAELARQNAELAAQAARQRAEEQVVKAEELRRKVEDAMREVERQTLEFRDGRLFVRPAEELELKLRQMEKELEKRRPQIEAEIEAEIERRLEAMEARFSELESRLNSRMERLADLMERMADRIEAELTRDDN